MFRIFLNVGSLSLGYFGTFHLMHVSIWTYWNILIRIDFRLMGCGCGA